MASDQEKATWIEEHLKYELNMLRVTFRTISKAKTQADVDPAWCASYESFVLHARNLYDFLMNKGDTRSFNADDFSKSFDASETPAMRRAADKTARAMDSLNTQVFHMGKRRPAGGPSKFNLVDCAAVERWIEEQFPRFESSLPPDFLAAWTNKKTVAVRPAEPSAPNQVSAIQFTIPSSKSTWNR